MTQIISAWHVTTDPLTLRRLGKLAEELAELQKVVARIIIQGIDEKDPGTKEPNRLALQKEIADVHAQMLLSVEHFKLSNPEISNRINKKLLSMMEWERLLKVEADALR